MPPRNMDWMFVSNAYFVLGANNGQKNRHVNHDLLCLERFAKDAKDVWAFSEEDETIVLSLATESPARFDSVGKALSVRLHGSCQGWRDEMVWGHIPMGRIFAMTAGGL
ncbi:hypothetical protein TNCV_2456881 [Trichonephila clavipes]|nr:hypothetical protein TNCV_2456881 [Trichonephila clavipes]